MKKQEIIVMSVGGSLIVPDKISVEFLKSLKNFIEEQTTTTGRRFIIIAGGGKTARRYQEAASEVTELKDDDLDWMGIHATRLNGHLLRTIFRDIAYREVITNPDDILDVPNSEKVIIAAGYRPGCSTDLRAVQIAQRVKSKKVVNLSDIDYVYDSDPRHNPNAKKIKNINWNDFIKLLPNEWDPGLSSPFDPIAAKESQVHEIEVVIINGHKLDSLTSYLKGDNDFVGTIIHN